MARFAIETGVMDCGEEYIEFASGLFSKRVKKSLWYRLTMSLMH